MYVLQIINGWYEFLISLMDHYVELFLIVFFVLSLYYIILRNKINGVFDPLCLSFIFSAFGCSVVVYMYFFDLLINEKYMYVFFATEIAYLIGYSSLKPINFIKVETVHLPNVSLNIYMYRIFSLIFIMLQNLSWILIGNPLQSTGSRLEFYNNGTGIVSIIIGAILPILIWLFLDKIFYYKSNIIEKLYDIFVGMCIFLSLLLAGAKSGFLVVVYILFFYQIYRGNSRIKSKVKKLLKYAIVCAILVMFVVLSHETELDNVMLLPVRILLRFVAAGDIFTYVYSDNILNLIKTNGFLEDVFSPLLAALRLIDYDEVNKSIGQQIWNFFSEGNRGPNPRHNVFGVLYFGVIGGIGFSFMVGLIISYIRNKLFKPLSGNLALYFIYIKLYINVSSFPAGGFSSAILGIVFFVIINLVIFFPSFWIYSAINKRGILK